MMTRKLVFAVAASTWSVVALAASQAPIDSGLQGKWSTACTAADQGSQLNVAEFTADTVTITGAAYTDSACATIAYSVMDNMGYQVGDQTQIPGAQSLDLTIQSISAVVQNEQYVNAFNQQKVCGIDTWKLNEPQDITGKVCSSDGSAMPSAGTKAYDVVKTDQSTDGSSELFFGDASGGNDGSSVDKRPTALDQKNTYKKQ